MENGNVIVRMYVMVQRSVVECGRKVCQCAPVSET